MNKKKVGLSPQPRNRSLGDHKNFESSTCVVYKRNKRVKLRLSVFLFTKGGSFSWGSATMNRIFLVSPAFASPPSSFCQNLLLVLCTLRKESIQWSFIQSHIPNWFKFPGGSFFFSGWIFCFLTINIYI